VGWKLTPEQIAALDAASATTPAYPYWHQWGFQERNPKPVWGVPNFPGRWHNSVFRAGSPVRRMPWIGF
jgi:hypothetical protein